MINGSAVSALDTAGAWMIYKLVNLAKSQGVEAALTGFTPEKKAFLQLIGDQNIALPVESPRLSCLAKLGQRVWKTQQDLAAVLAFIGESVHFMWQTLCYPFRLQWRELFTVIQQTGYYALPIIALLSYLVGVVLAYQMGLQLQNYGANIYVVDLLGVSILREFGPLITAIIVAGRTGAAYTAEIGTMKVNQEIDALMTMGVSPVDMLTIPRIVGLIIVLPLLTLWADIFGLLGGMVMSRNILDVGFSNFIQRFHEVVSFHTYYMGMIKTPVFALLIAAVGCYHGFRVQGNADSVGRETTKSVVHSIFLIIVADAIFSVIFGWSRR